MTLSAENGARPSIRPVLVATEVTWRSPTNQLILDRASLALARERVGLVGANGSGKTTLARILAGELAPTAGAVARSGTVAYLPQDFAPLAGHMVAQALGVHAKLAALERLTAGAGGLEDLTILDDDWSLETRVAAELDRLGLAHVALERLVETLSGGEATRVALAALFLRGPDLLILDEPTNNLDRAARAALYAAVGDWRGGLLVVSHDRELLRLMHRIAELSPHGLRVYGGNFDLYSAQRDAEANAARRELEEARRGVRLVRRQTQATRERQERRSSRGKRARDQLGIPTILLNAMRNTSEKTSARLSETGQEKVAAAAAALGAARERAAERAELDIALAPVELPTGKTVLEFDAVSFRYPGATRDTLTDFRLRVVGPERVALAGPNGSGKSTLLRLLLGELEPTAGRVEVGVERVTCLDQKAALLRPGWSVLENYRACNPGLSETECRLTLARFLFRTDAVHKPAAALSGGERLRAALACTLTAVAPPPLLLLDEPTNHLDLESLDNLEGALRGYTGALVVVSHDRTFLENIGVTRRVELPAPMSEGGL